VVGLRWKWGVFCTVGLLLLAGAGCSDHGTEPTADGGGGSGPTVSFAGDLQPVFAMRCLVCHGVGGNGGLDLTPATAWTNLVGMESMGYAPRLRVMAFNPDMSILYLKLNGAAGVGERMPLGSTLDVDTIEMFRVWIMEGALDN